MESRPSFDVSSIVRFDSLIVEEVKTDPKHRREEIDQSNLSNRLGLAWLENPLVLLRASEEF